MIELINVSKIYQGNTEKVKVLDNVSFKINSNEVSVVYGHSGVGKSTLLSIVGGLLPPTSGKVFFNGKIIDYNKDLSYLRREHLGFVFQDNYLLPEYNMLENLIVPQLINGKTYTESKKYSINMLKMINLDHLSNRYFSEVSRGEKQRISLIRSLINDPSLIIADEPTANLDENNCKQLLELIVKLNKELNKSFIIATHDQRFKGIASSIYNLFNGELIKDG